MSLCSTPLSPACEKELQRLVALIPDADLSVFAATEPGFLHGGFRAGNNAVLRTRVSQLVCGSQPVSDAMRCLIANRSRVRTLTGLLAPAVLSESRHALAALLGDEVLLVALLLDERPDVRGKAESWMQSPSPFLPIEPAEAQTRLRDLFAGLTELLGNADASAAGVPVTRESWQAQKEKLELRLLDLQEKNRRLKGVDDSLARVTHKLDACEKKLSATQSQLENAENELRLTARERDELKTELDRETKRREERLTAALDLALAHEFHGWLAEARAVEAVASEPASHAALLDRVEAALKKQRATDRHSGNRATLTERLDRLEAAQSQVRDALANALRPTQELKETEKELSAEIRSLKDLLHQNADVTPLEEALTARIHAAEDNDLPRLRDLPNLMATLDLLGGDALERLRLALQKRISAAQAAGAPLDPQTEERQDAASQLGRALAGHIPAILLIDGHNVLFGLPARYNPPRGGAVTDAEKRQKLTADVVRVTAPCPSVRTWIIFDGPTRSDAQASANVRVTYSGGTGEHRADGVILDNLRFFKSSSPETAVVLVSNDGDLCVSARRLGAQTVAVLNFGAFL
jgi:hypothetical protein